MEVLDLGGYWQLVVYFRLVRSVRESTHYYIIVFKKNYISVYMLIN